MKKTPALTILAAGLLALAALPAHAGEIDFEGLTQANGTGTPSSDPLLVPQAIGTIDGATFSGFFVDRDEGTDPTGYQGLGSYFDASAGTVAANWALGFDYADARYGQYADYAGPINDSLLVDFGSDVGHASFDFVTNPDTVFSVQLLDSVGGNVGTAFSFQTQLGTNSVPLVATASMSGVGTFRSMRISLATDQIFAMDDLSFGAAVVPLPPAAVLGLGLLAGIGILKRLRRRSS